MGLIETYFGNLFHEDGPKKCVPECPAEIVPWFHPHAVFHAYFIGSKDCKTKAKQGLPFFTENYGPKWTEYTTVVHEIAGHHVEVWSCLIVTLLSSHPIPHIQLFREKLSYKIAKAYATRPKGIMGSVSLPLFDQSSLCLSSIEEKSWFLIPALLDTVNFDQAMVNDHSP